MTKQTALFYFFLLINIIYLLFCLFAYMKHNANEIISGSASTPVDSGSKSLVNFKGRTTFGREGIL